MTKKTCFYDAISMIEFVLRLKISLRETIKTRRIKENHVSHVRNAVREHK